MPDIKVGITGSGITPEQPAKLPEELKNQVFSTESMPSLGASEASITTDKGIEVKEVTPSVEVVKETKTEPVKETPKVTSIIKPPKETPTKTADKLPVKPISPIKDKPADTFDYSKYSPEVTDHLKNMSRPAREYVSGVLKNNEELAKLKDSNYLQHEHGYTLSPEYRQLQDRVQSVNLEGQCWEKSLLDIKAGKKYREIVGFDTKGQPQWSEEREPTDKDEIRILGNVQACSQALQTASSNLQQYPNRFKQAINNDLRVINDIQKEKFAWVADPKMLKHTMDVEGQGEQSLETIKSNFKSIFPSYLATSVGVEVASNLMLALMIQGEELKQARNGQRVAEIKTKETQRGEPSSEAAPTERAASKNGVPSTFSLEGMPTGG